MIVNIRELEACRELQIDITCRRKDREVDEIVEFLHRGHNKIQVYRDNRQSILLRQDDIYFIETVDKRTFIYGQCEQYECNYRLYQLEELLLSTHFFRISKSMIINIFKVTGMEAESGRRLKLTLDNEERLLVSRQYVGDFKRKLGFGKEAGICR